MEGYQIGKDIVALNMMVTQHTNDIKVLTQALQQTRDILESFAKIEALEYNLESKEWERIKKPALVKKMKDE